MTDPAAPGVPRSGGPRSCRILSGDRGFLTPCYSVTSPKPSSSLFFTSLSATDEDSRMNAVGQGAAPERTLFVYFEVRSPAEAYRPCFSPSVSLSCSQAPRDSVHQWQLFSGTKGLFNYLKIFFNNTFFPNKDDG